MNSIISRALGASAAVALAAGVSLAATPQAHAADVWDRVAQCESSGNWSINTGNGFHGGLQFHPRTWRGFGGGQYAPTANKASKAEQIAVARRVLAVQGPGAWPVCSKRAGLTKANGGADRNATVGSTTSKPTASKPKASKPTTSKSTASKPKTSKPAASKGTRQVTVRSGDTMAKLARQNNIKGGWQAVAKANPQIRNPHAIHIGQRILLP